MSIRRHCGKPTIRGSFESPSSQCLAKQGQQGGQIFRGRWGRVAAHLQPGAPSATGPGEKFSHGLVWRCVGLSETSQIHTHILYTATYIYISMYVYIYMYIYIYVWFVYEGPTIVGSCSLSPLKIGASVTPTMVSPFNSGWILDWIWMDGLHVQIKDGLKSQTHQNPINSIPRVFKDWSKSIWLWFAPSQVKDVCHPVSSPNSMYNRFLQTRGRAAKGWRLCRAFRGNNWWGWKKQDWMVGGFNHYKRSNQNQSLEVIKIITVDHHLQIWSNKNMSGTGMLPHKGRILRQFKRGIALYFETPPQNSDPISIIGCTLW